MNIENRKKITIHTLKPSLLPTAPPRSIMSTRSPAQRTLAVTHKPGRLAQQLMANRPTVVVRRPPKPIPFITKHDVQSSNDIMNNIRGTKIGNILIIVGCGPSRTEAGLEKLSNMSHIDIMSINEPYPPIWPTTMWTFCDNSKLKLLKSMWSVYSGVLFNSTAIRETKKDSIMVKTLTGKGFSHNLIVGMYMGRSTVYAAMQIGLWLGYDHIYVFGCDMCAVGGKLYEWGSNPDVADDVRLKRFQGEADNYDWAAEHLSKDIVEKYTFCTAYNPFKFVDKFGRFDHRTAVDKILEVAQMKYGV
jgi:hypothetical protein